MRVGFDEQVFLAQRHGGISRYVVSLVAAFRQDSRLGVDAVTGWRWSDNQHSNAAGLSRRLPLPELSGRLAVLGQGGYFLANAPRRRAARQADILHHTYFHPRFMAPRSPARQVCTVYDMIPELYPESFPTRDPHLAKRRYVATCDMVLCISASARQDIHRPVRRPRRPDAGHAPGRRPGVPAGRRAAVGMPPRYLLFIGRRAGYKDFDVLAQAMTQLADREVSLVVVGGGSFTDDETAGCVGSASAERTLRVNVTDDELCRLYAHALAFVFPSRHEGFGLPTLEAMASGTAVVLADSSSHPEVGGEVARYFPIGDSAALAGQLDLLLGDDALRARLGKEGVRARRSIHLAGNSKGDGRRLPVTAGRLSYPPSRAVAWWSRNHLYVSVSPSRSAICGRQPSALIRDVSSSLRGVPSGLLVSCTMAPRKPTTSATISATSRMVMSSPTPTLIVSARRSSPAGTAAPTPGRRRA